MERRIKIEHREGFVLIEMMVALFIFSLITTAIVGVFIVSYKSQQFSKTAQQDLENVRVAMELMAKNIRMSTLDEGNDSSIYIYNYSQGKCIGYRMRENVTDSSKKSLEYAEERIDRLDSDGNIENCESVLINSDFSSLTSDSKLSSVYFKVRKTSVSEMGKVTIVMILDNNSTPFETTVSLRDYN
jgi:prepilin-type N-terminal cleavage/methylation domain-containing protein